jgi:Stress responsive A/B Barrel Domain
MKTKFWILFTTFVISISFFCGLVAGRANLNTPNTIIHHVALKWKDNVSDADKQKAITMLKEIVASTPGAKSMWSRPIKIQPREYSQTFVIEFENEEALKSYAAHPKKKAWEDFYYNIREKSFNCVTGN